MALEDPVASLLPEWVRVPTQGRRQIRLVDLATQTSGLPRLPTNLRMDPVAMGSYTVEQLYAFLSGYALTRSIGAEYEYSNTGFGLLGHALALRAGTSYEDLLRARILEPLGMATTAVTLTPAMEQLLALPHDDRGKVVAVWHYGALLATGAICSTMPDMLRFAAANLDPTAGPLRQAMAMAHVPLRDAVAGMRIGLAWHTRRVIDWDSVWHSGDTGGSRSFLGLDLERHRAAVVLSNSISRVEDLGFRLLDQRSELAQEEAFIQLGPEVLERYVGVYALSPEGTVTVTRTDTGLMAEATGLGMAPIYAASETELFVKVLPIRLTFSPGQAGVAMRIRLRFAGDELTGVKVSDG